MGSQITIRKAVCQVASSRGTCQAETKAPERLRALRAHVLFEELQEFVPVLSVGAEPQAWAGKDWGGGDRK